MRLIGLILAFWATISFAQQQQNYINVPSSGFNAVAGQPITITWSNPSSGTVTIRLTQGNVNAPNSGVVLDASVPASAETATFTIPTDVNLAAYNFAIVDDSDSSNINFSSAFTITGGSDTASASATASASSGSATASASATASLSSLSSSASSASASASSSASSASSSHSSMTRSLSSSASSATASATSVAASNDGGVVFGVSGMAALLAGAIAVF